MMSGYWTQFRGSNKNDGNSFFLGPNPARTAVGWRYAAKGSVFTEIVTVPNASDYIVSFGDIGGNAYGLTSKGTLLWSTGTTYDQSKSKYSVPIYLTPIFIPATDHSIWFFTFDGSLSVISIAGNLSRVHYGFS